MNSNKNGHLMTGKDEWENQSILMPGLNKQEAVDLCSTSIQLKK